MANEPTVVTIPATQWEKVAANVTSANIVALSNKSRFTCTYRITGGGAPDPTAADVAKSPRMESRLADFDSDVACDIWMYNPDVQPGDVWVASS